MKYTKYIVILSLFISNSCKTNKLGDEFNKLGKLDIRTVAKLEKEKQSKEIIYDYSIGIGESIYPNKNKYILSEPKAYEIIEKPNFKLETKYYYTVNDSLVKVIFYQWDCLHETNNDNYKKTFKAFQTKFENLTDELTKEFGEPISKNIEQGKTKDETFRDDINFKRADGLNAYLFMFGNDSNGYRQIILAVYKD